MTRSQVLPTLDSNFTQALSQPTTQSLQSNIKTSTKLLKVFFSLGLAASTLNSLPVHAIQKGWFAGVNAEYAELEITNKDTHSYKNGSAGRVFAGFNFLPHIGLELGLIQYNDFDAEDLDTSLSIQQAYLGAVLTGKLNPSTNIFAKVLVQQSSAEFSYDGNKLDDSSDLGWTYELGLSYHFHKNWAATANYAYRLNTFNDEFDYTTNSAGLGITANF